LVCSFISEKNASPLQFVGQRLKNVRGDACRPQASHRLVYNLF
jgi:hypothetical protein